jgi:hypothetical protein
LDNEFNLSEFFTAENIEEMMRELEQNLQGITREISNYSGTYEDPHDDPNVICLGNGVHIEKQEIKTADMDEQPEVIYESLLTTLGMTTEIEGVLPAVTTMSAVRDFVTPQDMTEVLKHARRYADDQGHVSLTDGLNEQDMMHLYHGAIAMCRLMMASALHLNNLMIRAGDEDEVRVLGDDGGEHTTDITQMISTCITQLAATLGTIVQMHSVLYAGGYVDTIEGYKALQADGLLESARERWQEKLARGGDA